MAGKVGTELTGKGGKPVLQDEALDPIIDEFLKQKAAADTAAALRDAAKDQLIEAIRPARYAACEHAGSVVASIKVNGRLTFTQQARYSVVPEDRTGDIERAFGGLDPHFKQTFEIRLKTAAANDEDVLQQLVDRLGADFFAAHFEVKRDLVVQPAFHKAVSTDPALRAIAQPFIDDRTIRPYAPSLKES